jgi:hypothetical protein
MRHFNIIGSLVYSIIGYFVLLQGEYFGIKTIQQFYIYSTYFILAYLATQAIGVMNRDPGKQTGFLYDLLFSTIPAFIAFESYRRGISTTVYYEFFRTIYTATALFDIVVFTIISLKYARLVNEYVVRD